MASPFDQDLHKFVIAVSVLSQILWKCISMIWRKKYKTKKISVGKPDLAEVLNEGELRQ